MPRIAIVHPSDPVSSLSATGGYRWRTFFTELERLGFSEGKNLQVDRHSGGSRPDRYAELAKEVAERSPNAIVTNSTRMALHFMKASGTVPVVAFTGDPVAAGITSSLARPSGNVTGVITDAARPMEPYLQRIAQRTGVHIVKGALESPCRL